MDTDGANSSVIRRVPLFERIGGRRGSLVEAGVAGLPGLPSRCQRHQRPIGAGGVGEGRAGSRGAPLPKVT